MSRNTNITPQERAAYKRIDVAIKHLEEARTALDAACADLSSVIGAGPAHNRIRKLSNMAIEIRRDLDDERHVASVIRRDLDDDVRSRVRLWSLDHDPSPQELRCGHGLRHGCGKGRKRS